MSTMASPAEPREVAVDPHSEGHDWELAGEAWGHAAGDWACLMEHYAQDALAAILQRIEVGPGDDLLDIACGSGWAARHAASMGPTVTGIDASRPLLEIARDRNPESEMMLGSMFELPWENESFDAAMSINGVWGGCDAAVEEAFRVLRPGARIGISFWGNEKPNDLRACFRAFAVNAPRAHRKGMKRTNDIATPGIAEDMFTDAGFDVLERGSRISVLEWPDAETAWRAISSTGPALPSLQHSGREHMREEILKAIEHCQARHGTYRFRNEQQFVIARKP